MSPFRVDWQHASFPAAPKRWQSWDDITDVFAGRPDPEWERDRDLIDQSVADPGLRSR